MQLTLQPHDHELISALPSKWRNVVTARLLALQQYFGGLVTKSQAMQRLAVSRATFDRLLNKVQEGGWSALVPEYRGVSAPIEDSLPEAFIEFWRMLVEKNQRKTAPAYRRLLVIWRARVPFEIDGKQHDHVPGYPSWQGWPNLPTGWGLRTMYRKKPTQMALTAMRQGLGKARMKHGAKVLSTRVGLHHMSHVLFDDVKLDLKAHLAGSRKLVVPLQLGALELLSGSRFAHGMKPQLYRADGTRESLNEGDMRFLLCSVLRHQGISARGTTFVVEHGTAAIRQPVRDILQRAFGDLVRCEDSGMIGDLQAIAGTYDGRGARGNPNHKAALESLHNLIHNELAFLPAQTGHDRNAPEFLGVLERDHEDLFRLAQRLPPEVRALLRHRTPEYHTQAVPLINGILDAINRRTDHNNEGWLELGFISKRYRLMPDSDAWIPEHRLLEMAPAARTAILSQADADARCWERVKMSPHDVFETGRSRGDLVKVPDSVIAEILYQDLAMPKRVHDTGEYSSCFAWDDQEFSVSTVAFHARVKTPQGQELTLTRGETYDVVLNPFDPSVLWVFSATRQRGSFLGIAERVQRICRLDTEAKKEQWKRAARDLREHLEPVRRRHAATTDAEISRLKHNRKVIEQHSAASAAALQNTATVLSEYRASQLPTAPADDGDAW